MWCIHVRQELGEVCVQPPHRAALDWTDIDADTVRMIQTSQHFTGAGHYDEDDDFTFTHRVMSMMVEGRTVVYLSLSLYNAEVL